MTSTTRIDDEDLQRAVQQELEWTPDVDSAGIGVAVEDGTVALSGEVDSHTERLAARHAALRVRGVNAVIDHLGLQGIFAGGVANIVGIAEIAVYRIHVHPKSLGELREQCFLAAGEARFVLRSVVGGDAEQRFFVDVRVNRMLSRVGCVLHAGRCAQPFAGVGGNRAVAVAGLFGAHAGQLPAQFVGLGGRYIGQCRARHHQAGDQSHGDRRFSHQKPPVERGKKDRLNEPRR